MTFSVDKVMSGQILMTNFAFHFFRKDKKVFHITQKFTLKLILKQKTNVNTKKSIAYT